MPTRGASAGQVSRRRGSGRRPRATVLGMEDEARPEAIEGADATAESPDAPRELDLLTIGLVVFFVALIGTVAAMLLLTVR
jgi:hypothetical protein